MAKFQAFISDMDDTLLRSDHTMSERTAATLRRISRQGVSVVLCSGRAGASILPYVHQAGAEGEMICFNGARVIDLKTGAVLVQNEIDPGTAREMLSWLDARGCYAQFFDGDSWYCREDCQYARDYEKKSRLPAHFTHAPLAACVKNSAPKLLGIGPDKIEVDAPFVPGNSGGPVVLDEGGEVIGVSTYLRILEPDRSTTGSKYEATKLKRQVRRFATRIDNLDPSDLEPVFLEKIGRERELVRRSSEWVSSISDTFKEDEEFTLERFQDFREECFRRCRVLIEGEAAEWSNTYLRNKFSENREMIEAVLKVLKLDFLVEISRIGVLLDEHASSLLSVKREGSPVRCFFCMGSGKNSIKKPNPLYRPKSAYARWVIERRKCPVCNGNGKRPLWSERICFTYPKELEDAAGRHIAEAGQTFCGFLLGGTEQQELARFVFYRKKPLYRIPNAFGETLVFAGNHFDRSATCTALTFMFGRLLCVEIVTPQLEKGGIREGLTRYLKEELSDSSPFYVQAIRIVDRKMIPLDLRGRPLLKPVKPQRMEDDPEYDGMIVRGVHSCFGAINALDLNSLAEKNRKAQNQ